MKRTFSAILATFILALTLVSCTPGAGGAGNIAEAKSIADLKGMTIGAQAGTFHAEAAKQIEDVKLKTFPEFADMLVALKAGTIDGYIAEEPTARSVCSSDSSLDYLHFVNNETGFTVTAADVGIAVGLKTGSELRERINEVLATITDEVRDNLMLEMIRLSAGEKLTSYSLVSEPPATPNGVLKVAMECAYEPYNWTETSDFSYGAVRIANDEGANYYANGYDVRIAQYIADKLGMKLEIYKYEWDSLIPAVQSGAVDAIIAGMSPTAEREEQIDFTDVYYMSTLVVIYKKK
ncbi:MAG: transporter substrate-binding domain-containing protein [Clostridiales bacterium]|jgi:ABC-type amino acid transport substrate-binding protein|nr:transporter substrate-binding domain-containing protein [Clostridiales bacterium]